MSLTLIDLSQPTDPDMQVGNVIQAGISLHVFCNAVALSENQTVFIQWKFQYSAWHVFVHTIDTLIGRITSSIQPADAELEARLKLSRTTKLFSTSVLKLMDQLLKQDPNLAFYLEEHSK